MQSTASPPASARQPIAVALALSLGAAVSLGITRFSYALLLPVMRDDLGWSYTLAGGMNTANALGYLLGALVTPPLLRLLGPARVLLWGCVLASVFMAACGFFTDATMLLVQRLLAGVASAFVFIAGGLLAARLGQQVPERAGLLLGLYYGGVGWGIAASALGVPPLLAAAGATAHGWAWAWWGLAVLCVLATVVVARPAAALAQPEPAGAAAAGAARGRAPGLPWLAMAPMLAGYTLFGVGYIGYMTFVIALLREQGASDPAITGFYTLLGLAVVGSARVWARLLDRAQGGGALALLNALLGIATVLPALTGAWPVVLVSGLLFGGVFLSLVASTTAFVRHNLPSAQWAAGISAFTIIFAFGQIVGPTVVGWIADGPGGLARGHLVSAAALWLGALVAWRQRPLAQ
ncbi:MAG TPA: YbfB/YjiJ family MFS transporter [Ottowia sp.]|uniref:YbfB/YjiJ family MFS transporter n=1 Tax=Ottowia sp. TaxID=1898956 RepID=UPI002B890A1E|nr:YbfB/YjiJ family MFS transporter [Ottowia sp.]HMN22491.1 YbfB/YjiJ family MFS transporter [Ottowia sp.]